MRIKTLQIREEKNMKQSVRRIAAWIMVMLLLCPAVSALAEGAEESAPAANTAEPAPQETAEPTERPKVSAAELQSQGILTVGAKGDEVTKLQQRLKELGYLSSKVDGKFGGGTKRAVIAFQRRNGLNTDGEAGADTLAKLYSEEAVAAPGEEKTDVLAGDVPMLLNKEHSVDEFFTPADLVNIKDVLGTKLAKIKYKNTMGVRTAVEALKAMLEAAKADGLGKKWQIAAGYRSWDQQVSMLNQKVNAYKKKNKGWSSSKARRAALKSVAEPGSSEHHLGLAFDINKQGSSSFAGTKHSQWLNEHCWEYGFIIRYTKEKEAITGFVAEPWHIRYVGVEHAMYMKEHDLCLEEYIQGIENGTIENPMAGRSAESVPEKEAGADDEPADEPADDEPADEPADDGPADEAEDGAGEEEPVTSEG